MADAPLENKPGTSSTNSGNDDLQAKVAQLETQLADEKKAHNVTSQQRNMYKNKAEEHETKISELTKKHEDLQGDFDNLRSEKEKTEKAQAINAKKAELLKDYPDDVKAKAEKLGIDLADPEDADAVKSFTDRLDVLKGDSAGSGDNGEGEGKPPAPKITSDNKRPEGDKIVKSDEEILADEEAKLADLKF